MAPARGVGHSTRDSRFVRRKLEASDSQKSHFAPLEMAGFMQVAVFVFVLFVALFAFTAEARPYDDELGNSFYRNPQFDQMRGFMSSRFLEKRVPNAADMMIRFGKRSGGF